MSDELSQSNKNAPNQSKRDALSLSKREWKEYKLGELVQTNRKSINSEYPFELIEYLDTSSITRGKIDSFQRLKISKAPSRAKRLVEQDDIIYSTVRPIQRHYGFIDKPLANLVVSTGFTTITCNKEQLDSKFLYYFLTSNDTVEYLDIIAEASTSAYPSLRPSDIENLDINIPEMKEQKAIAAVLSSLDDKIDLFHRQNKTLEAMAETLFREYFIENADEGWEEVQLKKLIDIKGGFSYKGKHIGEGTSVLLGMGCVSFNNRFLHTGARPYSGVSPINHIVKPGDLVIATRQQSDNMPILGFPAIIPEDYKGKKVIVGTNLYRVINNSKLDNFFFYRLFKSADYRRHILSCAKGTTVRMITKDSIESYVISKPPNKLYDRYQSIAKPINEKVIINDSQIRTLEKLRDTLLPKLMSGEVRVKKH